MNIAKEETIKVFGFGFGINCLVSKICSFEKLFQDENPTILCLQVTKLRKPNFYTENLVMLGACVLEYTKT